MKWVQYITNDIEVIHEKIAVLHSTRQKKKERIFSVENVPYTTQN